MSIPPNVARAIDIAIVDDEASVRISLRRLCNALGFNATAYPSGQAFLDALDGDATSPGCLLLDTQMPEMTGIELHRQILGRGLVVPTVVVTADDSPDVRARCLAIGLHEYMRKPIGADELLAAIERAVGKVNRLGSPASIRAS